jgi:hypothetical protein
MGTLAEHMEMLTEISNRMTGVAMIGVLAKAR